MERKVRSSNDTIKLLQQELSYVAELTKLGRRPDGVLAEIAVHVLEEVEKGAMAEVRETYALRSTMEKEIMKLQNQ